MATEYAYENAPEVVSASGLPEVAKPQQQEQYQHAHQQGYQQQQSPWPLSQNNAVEPETRKSSKGVICGCTTLVFVLSCVIAVLCAAVVGLAAGTGIEANRAGSAETKLAALNASIASTTPTPTASTTPTATAFNELDNGCSNDPDAVTGTTYQSFDLLGDITFTMYCNKDAQGTPYMSLFTSDFDACMDACAAYSVYMPKVFTGGGDANSTTCGGVSFIPLWTAKANATLGHAPGNCYLKPEPQDAASLAVPNIGTECHAAIVRGG